MAEKIVSPGVFTNEIDASFLPAAIGDIGAAIIGPTVKGPHLTPTVVESYAEYQAKFGDSFKSGSQYYTYFTSIAAKNYLQHAGRLTVVRVAGDGITNASASVSTTEDATTGDTAVGLTQVRGLALEDVNKELGTNYSKDDLLNDPEISKLVGKTYLNQQLKRFGDKKLALAAYNYGPTNVEELTQGSMLNYHKLPPKVKDYVSFVLGKVIPEIKPKPLP